MGDTVELSVKARKSCENLTSNGGIENSCAVQHEAVSTTAVTSPTKRQLTNREERASLVLWKRPITTLQYFFKEVFIVSYEYGTKILTYYRALMLCILLSALVGMSCHVQGPHQKYLTEFQMFVMWQLYWAGLGVLSSIGLGTGLHTFVLYLGPFITSVALAAYECNSVNFPQPPYPDEIICPETPDSEPMTVLKIMHKVRLETILWGIGTAIGELPPYFMARAARLSGQDIDDEDLKEFEELQQKKNNPEEQSLVDKAKLVVERLVEKVGFFGILVCASIPNPLFDLAGITCGHFLVPFWTFFGATLIGKAIIKTHIQKLFVIIAFSEHKVQKLLNHLKSVPVLEKYLHDPLQELLVKQKAKFHRKPGASVHSDSSWISFMFEKFVLIMVAYFVLSIINSMAQNHHKRLQKRHRASTKVATD